MTGGHVFPGRFAMALLIVEEHVRAERLQKGPFGQPAQEQAFVQANAPAAQGAHHPFMGRRRAGGDQRGANRAALRGKLPLNLMQGFQKEEVATTAICA